LKHVFVGVESGLDEVAVDYPRLPLLGDHEAEYGSALVLRHARHVSVEWELVLALLDEFVELGTVAEA